MSENWRNHISYLKYLNICTAALHKVVRAEKSAKYQRCSIVAYEAREPDEMGGYRTRTKVPTHIKDY